MIIRNTLGFTTHTDTHTHRHRHKHRHRQSYRHTDTHTPTYVYLNVWYCIHVHVDRTEFVKSSNYCLLYMTTFPLNQTVISSTHICIIRNSYSWIKLWITPPTWTGTLLSNCYILTVSTQLYVGMYPCSNIKCFSHC